MEGEVNVSPTSLGLEGGTGANTVGLSTHVEAEFAAAAMSLNLHWQPQHGDVILGRAHQDGRGGGGAIFYPCTDLPWCHTREKQYMKLIAANCMFSNSGMNLGNSPKQPKIPGT